MTAQCITHVFVTVLVFINLLCHQTQEHMTHTIVCVAQYLRMTMIPVLLVYVFPVQLLVILECISSTYKSKA